MTDIVNSTKDGKELYLYGIVSKDTSKTYNEAYRLIKTGADLGDSGCLYDLAVMLINGYECRKNYKRARVLLEQASINGNSDADYTLGRMYYDGKGVKKDFEKSQKLREGASEKGSELAIRFWERETIGWS